MKKLIIFSLLMVMSLGIIAQPKIYSLTQNKSRKIMNKIENNYINAIGQDSLDGVFFKEEDVNLFFEKWKGFMKEMMTFFENKDISLNEVMFLRIFFNEDGKADYLFYSIKDKNSLLLSKKGKNNFEKVLKEFLLLKKIEHNSGKKIKQCGTLRFQNKR